MPVNNNSVSSQTMNYRYPGADSFRDDDTDRRIFFGRDAEIAEVLNRVLSNKLLVMYAKSGLGKTSLLQAGLFPELRARDYIPIRLRFNIRPETNRSDSQARGKPSALRSKPQSAPSQNNQIATFDSGIVKDRLNKHLLQELKIAVDKTCAEQAVLFTEGEGETYWEYFNTAVFTKGDRFLTPVLILDQFEEVFTLQNENYRKQLGEQLRDLVSGQMPDSVRERLRAGEKLDCPTTPPAIRVLISLREDAVGALQELTGYLPGILTQRFRLTQLDAERARNAIIKPAGLEFDDDMFKAKPFSYQPETVSAILDYLQDRDHNIEPFQLQLLCRHIEEHVIAQQHEAEHAIVVDLDNYLGGITGMDDIIKRFYQTAVNSLPGWSVRRKARTVCETGLINPEGRRESLSGRKIKLSFGLAANELASLVDKKVLRREERLGYFHQRQYQEMSDNT